MGGTGGIESISMWMSSQTIPTIHFLIVCRQTEGGGGRRGRGEEGEGEGGGREEGRGRGGEGRGEEGREGREGRKRRGEERLSDQIRP